MIKRVQTILILWFNLVAVNLQVIAAAPAPQIQEYKIPHLLALRPQVLIKIDEENAYPAKLAAQIATQIGVPDYREIVLILSEDDYPINFGPKRTYAYLKSPGVCLTYVVADKLWRRLE